MTPTPQSKFAQPPFTLLLQPCNLSPPYLYFFFPLLTCLMQFRWCHHHLHWCQYPHPNPWVCEPLAKGRQRTVWCFHCKCYIFIKNVIEWRVMYSDVKGLAWALKPSQAEPRVAQAVTGRRVGLQWLTAQASIFSGREPKLRPQLQWLLKLYSRIISYINFFWPYHNRYILPA